MPACRRRLAVLFVLASVVAPATAWAHGSSVVAIDASAVPSLLAVRKELAEPPKGVAELRFRDLFTLPIGSMGMQPSERLRQLDGQRVRMVGFAVRTPDPGHAGFALAPLPVEISSEDEAQADDIPANAVLVVLPKALPQPIPNLGGLLQVTGVLRVGNIDDAETQRVFPISIQLDDKPSRALARLARAVAGPSTRTRQPAP